MPIFYEREYCMGARELENNKSPRGARRASEMAAAWVRQLRWAAKGIPPSTRAAEDVLKVISWPEWTFRAVPGTPPLRNTDVARIRQRIQRELARVDKGGKPVYANFLVITGGFYYGGQVAETYLRPVHEVEVFARCGALEPYRSVGGKTNIVTYAGRRSWVEPAPAGGKDNRAWAMFNCVDTYFVKPVLGGAWGHLRGPFIRCKSKQSEMARQKHPFREVWGRCAVVDAEKGTGPRIEDVFDAAASKSALTNVAALDASLAATSKASYALSEAERSTPKNEQLIQQLKRDYDVLNRKAPLLRRAVDNSRWPELADFAADPFFIVGSLKIAIDICADHGSSAETAARSAQLLPAGSNSNSQADLYFIVSNGMNLKLSKLSHTVPGGWVLRTDGHGPASASSPSSMYYFAKNMIYQDIDGELKVDNKWPSSAAASDHDADFRNGLLSQRISWGFFWLDNYALPSHELSVRARKDFEDASARMVDRAQQAGVAHSNSEGTVVAFILNVRAFVLDKGKKWGRSFFGFIQGENRRHLIIRQRFSRDLGRELFLEQYNPASPEKPALVWRLPVLADTVKVLVQKKKGQGWLNVDVSVQKQAAPCLLGDDSFLQKHPTLQPWIVNGCGKRQPCICIALDHYFDEHHQNRAIKWQKIMSDTQDGGRKRGILLQPRVMRTVIDDNDMKNGGADFLLVLRTLTDPWFKAK